MKQLFCILFTISPLITVFSQQTILAWQRNNEVKLRLPESDSLTHPWNGGLNYCQFSELDLNQDGINDLVVFDRSGDRIIPFVYDGPAGTLNYRYAPEYIYAFPPLTQFALFKDINCDGKNDILSYASGGISAYLNTSDNTNGLRFTPYAEAITHFNGQLDQFIFTLPIDIPAFEDMDGDGDLDVMVFSLIGSCVEYYRNYAQENLQRCDTLLLRLETSNWGNFTESFNSNSITLNDSCDGQRTSAERHAGSTLCVFDNDGDGDMDLLLGDIAYKTMLKLVNGGSVLNANIVEQIPNFPINTEFINISIFPAAFYLDVDHDGLNDLLVSPNSRVGSENFRSIWFYRNVGSADIPEFELQTKSFLLDESLDFGDGAIPVFFDYNNDGKMDVVVGNVGYFDNNSYKSQLALLENIGTTENPEFLLVNRDFAGLASIPGNTQNYHPTFGDLDGDGDADMLVGMSDGRILHYENTATPGAPASFVLRSLNFQSIDVGTFAAPFLFDINGNGLPDLFIGNRTGRVHYYKNESIGASFNFSLQTEQFGNVLTALEGDPNGFATPVLFKRQGQTYLIAGSISGNFRLYSDVSDVANVTFTLLDSTIVGTREGVRSSVALADLNQDGFLDAITGNLAGGLLYWSGILPTSSPQSLLTNELKLYPNPANDQMRILGLKLPASLRVNDISGRQVIYIHQYSENQTIPINELGSGIYFVSLQNAQGFRTLRFIKK